MLTQKKRSTQCLCGSGRKNMFPLHAFTELYTGTLFVLFYSDPLPILQSEIAVMGRRSGDALSVLYP